MTPITAAEAAGVRNPSASSAPPPASDAPAASAARLPGFRPIESKAPAVPSRPWPPNQPKSFWAPCAKSVPPTVMRKSVCPSAISGAYPDRGPALTRCEQLVDVERGVDRGRVVRSEDGPLLERPVPRQLEIVAVRIGQVHREVGAVVGELAQRHAGVEQAPDGLRQPGLRREVQRDVVQARDAVRLRRPTRRLPRVEAEVMVIAAGREEEDV